MSKLLTNIYKQNKLQKEVSEIRKLIKNDFKNFIVNLSEEYRFNYNDIEVFFKPNKAPQIHVKLKDDFVFNQKFLEGLMEYSKADTYTIQKGLIIFYYHKIDEEEEVD